MQKSVLRQSLRGWILVLGGMLPHLALAQQGSLGEVNLQGLSEALISANGEALPQSVLDKRYLFVYYGAQWCPNCQKFSPRLKDFYAIYKRKYNDFEIIFWGDLRDTSGKAAQDYALEENYSFPLLAYEKRSTTFIGPDILSRGQGVPSLVLIDRQTGKKIADSFLGEQGQDYHLLEPFRHYLEDLKEEKNPLILR